MASNQHAQKTDGRDVPARTTAGSGAEPGTRGIAAAMGRLQAAAGNAATSHMIQTKLTVGSASDPLEREADRVAAQVVASERTPTPDTTSVSPATRSIARATTEDADHDVVGLAGGQAPAAAEHAIAKAGSGQALPAEIQRSMESVTGADLSGVRVHTGSGSDAAAQHLQARAFTTGKDIHFAAGEFNPGSQAGRELIAHEATHTIQQHGGSSAARKVIQRMPSPRAVKTRTGRNSKSGTKLFGKVLGATKTYNALIASIEAHSRYIMATEIAHDRASGMKQIAHIGGLVDGVVTAAQTYLAKPDADPSIAALCNELIANARLEKTIPTDVLGHWLRKANDMTGMNNPKWFSQLPDDPTKYTFKSADMRVGKVTDNGGAGGAGNNKSVAEVTNGSGETGFFADDDYTGAYDDNAYGQSAYMLGRYGVKGDLALGNRSIAMSRLDKLLSAGIIARTERGLLGDRTGTFQVKADGDNWTKAITKGAKTDDPNLARLLSRMQLIDAIAGQVDRHTGNYFIQHDTSGKITGVTGIDLDMAWGHDDASARLHFDMEEGEDAYPGFSRYVDKELAERIIALRPADLHLILVDLLEPAAVTAAISRLVKLQTLLQDGKSHLLEPKEWTAQIRAKLLDERSSKGWNLQKSYYGQSRAGEIGHK